MVDMPRQAADKRRKRVKHILFSLFLLVFLGATSWGIFQLEPAAPLVERSSVWLGKVEKGSMIIEVRGPGTLVPEKSRWVTASTDGRVEQIYTLPGSVRAVEQYMEEILKTVEHSIFMICGLDVH